MALEMAIAFRPAMIQAKAGGSRIDRSRKIGGGGGGAWWSPLFGWGSQPDYIDSGDAYSQEKVVAPDLAMDNRRSSPRICAWFTEEKAREMRMRLSETETFHDAMYHSAIASRLASDLCRGSGYGN
ncbi:uncharacterized protein LOC110019343 [Phalaenopsis equestris]|uniref:uncharacterized protein LOC110019343 n=1 Tax=Phalaenopsis equestris TaxID=78828 RepID=UPI0009E1B94A|nr:uncharacterized protein LOC110019343 [Phalaenopsis equestris]